ncbi:uncharacterized protein BXIN_1490 [Babesia sp. Xinjiang]|uniref:uncharacterized protein n=1 Tax=Babesia sp. Xinjiang TaxID=462227 RepID=UPI000A260B6D|nr:uncharacterized protein BXIN_1490 [Babesia sp. Xinjiang]ORM42259.1 hypothetical protein BXIN_1490 [Babesia sp. Xinjiang]
MFALGCLLAVVKYNVVLSPADSADYCYNWLLVLLEPGANTEEIQLVAMTPVHTVFRLIKDISGITDDSVIRECLEKHGFDVSETIIDLVNRSGALIFMAGHMFSSERGVSCPRYSDPQTHCCKYKHVFALPVQRDKTSCFKLLVSVVLPDPMIHRDYVNRPEVYDDDYDDNDIIEDGIMPLNAKIIYDEVMKSDSDVSEGGDGVQISQKTSSENAVAPPGITNNNSDRTATRRNERGGSSSRGNRGHRKYNRKRNTINMDAFG